MIQYFLAIFLFFSGLMMLPGGQMIPTTLAQENSLSETNAPNPTETNAANTTQTNPENEELQLNGSISRRGH
jgi:hypothetical protein